MICLANNWACWIFIKYKRLSTFCYTCGCYGHSMKDCERESKDEKDSRHGPVYRNWLRASRLKKTMSVDLRCSGSTHWKIFYESSMAEYDNVHSEFDEGN